MIGDKIREARIALNWTQDILAFKLKVTKNTVSKWERNKQEPTKEMQKKLERLLKIKLIEEKETVKDHCIGNVIKQARKAKKLTQRELASKLRVTVSKLSNWENNKSMPNEEMQEKLCQILELDSIVLKDSRVRINKDKVKKIKNQKELKEDFVLKETKEAENASKEELTQNNAKEIQDKDNDAELTQNTVTEEKKVKEEIIANKNYAPKYRKLPLGTSNFKKIRRDDMYYVDHTRVIKELVEKAAEVNLITRPRRFGKTLTLDMLRCFFEYGNDPQIFNGLEIAQYPDFCQKHQSQYPVIFLTFKDIDAPIFEDARAMLCRAIYNEANRFDFLATSSKLNKNDIEQYNELCQVNTMRNDNIRASLQILTQLLYKHYGKEVIVLIDEYDVPLTKAYHSGYYEEMLPLIRDMLQGLKDNNAVEFIVITGCLKISKESIFTGFNNVTVYSMLSEYFTDSLGFMKKEVKELLEYYHLEEKYDIIKEWYDGYRIGQDDIYCPWDVIQYVHDLNKNRNAEPKAYWMNTSSNEIIQDLLKKYGKDVRSNLASLLNGRSVVKIINEDIVYKRLSKSAGNIWSILFSTGYLKIEEKLSTKRYKLRIPNKEIREVMISFFEEWLIETYQHGIKKTNLKKFCDAIERGNIEGMESFLNNFLATTIRIQDYSRQEEQRESFYHGILLGLLEPQDERWNCDSNIETGDGHADIILSMQNSPRGIIIELKYARSENLELCCKEAMEQINKNNYVEYLREEEYEEVVKYAIAFYKKKCKVLKEEEKL